MHCSCKIVVDHTDFIKTLIMALE